MQRRGRKEAGEPAHLAAAGRRGGTRSPSSPRAWPIPSDSANMDFREILMIASKGQGTNSVPVSSRGDAPEILMLKLEMCIDRLELPDDCLSAPREERI